MGQDLVLETVALKAPWGSVGVAGVAGPDSILEAAAVGPDSISETAAVEGP